MFDIWLNQHVNICNAVFGTDVWPAVEYGWTMYTTRQGMGPLLKRMQKIWKIETGSEFTDKETLSDTTKRNSGVVSNKLREIQVSFILFKL